VLDETGEMVLEQKLGTTPKAMREVFGAMAHSRIALETGMHSPWVSRVLSELGHDVIPIPEIDVCAVSAVARSISVIRRRASA